MKLYNRSKKLFAILLTVIAVLGTLSIVIAQDVIEQQYDNVDMINGHDPSSDDVFGMAVNATLEDVTSNSTDYYGSVATIEGYVGEFLNAYAFTLGENAALDNDLVLVINNSSKPFNPDVMNGAHIQITGRVHPSLEAVTDGIEAEYGSMFTDDMTLTPVSGTADTDEMMDDNMMGYMSISRHNLVQFAQQGYFADKYDNYTIVEIVNRDNLSVLEQAPE